MVIFGQPCRSSTHAGVARQRIGRAAWRSGVRGRSRSWPSAGRHHGRHRLRRTRGPAPVIRMHPTAGSADEGIEQRLDCGEHLAMQGVALRRPVECH